MLTHWVILDPTVSALSVEHPFHDSPPSSKSEAVTLSAFLRKRVEILEAEVNSLSLDKKVKEPCEESQLAQVNSPIFCPADKGLCTFCYSSGLIR
jgi:hypothetical protein